jgi:predicted DNA-binding WGR domain protein
MRIYMQTPVTGERPPRFYQLCIQRDLLEGWTLVREWGNQGSAGRLVKEHFSTWEEAETVLMRWRDEQLSRGYRIVFLQGQQPFRS